MRICPSYAKGWYWISILFVKGINFYKWHSLFSTLFNIQQTTTQLLCESCANNHQIRWYNMHIWHLNLEKPLNCTRENIEYVLLDLFKCNEFSNGLSFQAMLCTAVEQSSSAANFVRIHLMKYTDVDLSKLNETYGRMCAYQIFGSLRGISEIIFFVAGNSFWAAGKGNIFYSFWGARNISWRGEQFLVSLPGIGARE